MCQLIIYHLVNCKCYRLTSRNEKIVPLAFQGAEYESPVRELLRLERIAKYGERPD
jgi:hypothetical protein